MCFCLQIEVPLWLAGLLQGKNAAQVQNPKHFKRMFIEHLEAGPASVNLREQSPHYFAVGDALARANRNDELQRKLLTAFTGDRFRRIMDLAFNR